MLAHGDYITQYLKKRKNPRIKFVLFSLRVIHCGFMKYPRRIPLFRGWIPILKCHLRAFFIMNYNNRTEME